MIMQQQTEWPADFAACKDKFLVLCTRVEAAAAALRASDADFAALFEGAGVMSAKLRVQYVAHAPPPSAVLKEPDNGDGAAAGGASTGAAGTHSVRSGAWPHTPFLAALPRRRAF
jgi:hypothetical protein